MHPSTTVLPDKARNTSPLLATASSPYPAVIRRIVIAQSLYASGAVLCFFNTWGIAAILLSK
jgi:hypothetical protein